MGYRSEIYGNLTLRPNHNLTEATKHIKKLQALNEYNQLDQHENDLEVGISEIKMWHAQQFIKEIAKHYNGTLEVTGEDQTDLSEIYLKNGTITAKQCKITWDTPEQPAHKLYAWDTHEQQQLLKEDDSK